MARVADTSGVQVQVVAIPMSDIREEVVALLKKYSRHKVAFRVIKDDRKIYTDLWVCESDLRNAMIELQQKYGVFGERIPDYRALGDMTLGALVEIIKTMRAEKLTM